MSGEVYLLWLLSLLQTVSIFTLMMSSCLRVHSCYLVGIATVCQLSDVMVTFVSRILLSPELQNDVAYTQKSSGVDVKPSSVFIYQLTDI